ncbi:MAG TPA: SRPBCC family protein [bacterium]|nr:SRPBCC family protein [bacterium]
MTEYAKKIDETTVRFERLLPGPIERVWAFLTESEKRRSWLAAGPMELRVGGGVELTFRNSQLAAKDEATPEKFCKYEGMSSHGRVLACEPPRLLTFTWFEGEGKIPSEVTFELSPRDGQVLLVLTHRHLADREGMLSVAGGWHTHLGVLKARLEGVDNPPFWASIAKLEKEYSNRL